MATVICPGENWKYQLGTNPPTSEDTVVGEDTVASLTNDNGFVRLFVKDFSPQQTVKMYAEFNEGVSIIDDNMVIIDTRLPPLLPSSRSSPYTWRTVTASPPHIPSTTTWWERKR